MPDFIILLLLILFTFVVMPLLISECLRLLGNQTQQFLVNNFGNTSQVLFGGIGVIIHELTHLITAVIFGHHIVSFRLLEPFKYKRTGSLGYVNYTCPNPDLYNHIGDFFIGISPCFACSGALLLAHRILFHQLGAFDFSGYNLLSTIKLSLANITNAFGIFGYSMIIYVVLVIMISSTGYGLSKADMKDAWSGTPYWIVLAGLLAVSVIFLQLTPVMISLLWKIATIWLTFLFLGLIYIAFSYFILKIFSYIL